jgi:hypothetical protein
MTRGAGFRFESARDLPGNERISRYGLATIRAFVSRMWDLEVEGTENVPLDGPGIVALEADLVETARARVLTLGAATAGLALPGRVSAAEPFGRTTCASARIQCVQAHLKSPRLAACS